MKKLRLLFPVLLILAGIFGTGMSSSELLNADSYAMVVVKSTPTAVHTTQLTIMTNDVRATLQRAKKEKVSTLPLTDRYLILRHKQRNERYVMDKEGSVWNSQTSERLLLPQKWKKKLQAYGDIAAASHYGKLLSWDQAKNEFPVKSVLTIMDMETGLRFKAQRRAGKYHADVQPLTKSDTKIMKQIYNGKWSWKRKAILIEKDGRHYAASMQGMPHGGDGIPGNNYPGHFCIHFRDSVTHGLRSKDPEHHLMIYKAAGELDAYFRTVSPHELVDGFIGAVNTGEAHMLAQFFMDARHPRLLALQKEMPVIQAFRRVSKYKKTAEPTSELKADIPVEIRMERKGKGAETAEMIFHVARSTKQSPWKIIAIEGGFSGEEKSEAVDAAYDALAPSPSPVQLRINLWHRHIELLKEGRVQETFKIGPGAIDTPSPVGIYRIISKSKGWGGGFGDFWLGLNVPWGIYGIHGTNKPELIGRYVSHGCFRMRNKDVGRLYHQVPLGTEVIIEGPITGHKEVSYRILVKGSRGALVQLVQNRLQAAGLYHGKCNGIFDARTERAVMQYQKQNRLPVTKQIQERDLIELGIIE
ncbi:L,D-transpeptidase family protein [Aneurinibacillus sp. BA2021]|nr:L,D-transpeptidase family protein [Aneurinibacillus sp. BA2021]